MLGKKKMIHIDLTTFEIKINKRCKKKALSGVCYLNGRQLNVP